MASAIDTARAAIESRIQDNWTTTPISWPGANFTPPDGPWIEPHVLWGEGTGETMSSGGTNTVPGVLTINLFDRPGSGLATLTQYADTLRDLFDRVTLGSVEFFAASGPKQTFVRDTRFILKGDTRWEQMNLSIPFILEETS